MERAERMTSEQENMLICRLWLMGLIGHRELRNVIGINSIAFVMP
jgi:hypothetical protein